MQKFAIMTVEALFGAISAFLSIFYVNKTAGNDIGEKKQFNPYGKKYIWIICIAAFFLCGGLTLYIYGKTTSTSALIQVGVLLALSISVALIDYKTKKIPNFIIILLLLSGLIFFVIKLIRAMAFGEASEYIRNWLLFNLVASLIVTVFLWVMSRITKGGMGMGDIKLVSSVCFSAGLRAAYSSLLFSMILCAVAAIPSVIKKKKLTSEGFAFGPFWLGGFVIAVILGFI